MENKRNWVIAAALAAACLTGIYITSPSRDSATALNSRSDFSQSRIETEHLASVNDTSSERVEGDAVRLIVVDAATGHALEGARVIWGITELVTSETGEATAAYSPEKIRCSVTLLGYATHSALIAPGEYVHTIALHKNPRALAGLVLPPSGSHKDLSEVEVLAWEVGTSLPRGRLSGIQVHPPLSKTRCNENGEFIFEGLPRDATVRLLAGGDGMCSRILSPNADREPDDEPILQLRNLYLARCKLRDQYGGTCAPSIHLSPPFGIQISPLGVTGAQVHTIFNPGVRISGWDKVVPLELSSSMQFAIVSSAEALAESVNLNLNSRLPGYKDASSPLRAYAYDSVRRDNVQDIQLVRTAEGFSSIIIRPNDDFLNVSNSKNFLQLRVQVTLSEVNGAFGFVTSTTIGELRDGISIDHVPFGTYQGHVQWRDGTLIPIHGASSNSELKIDGITLEAHPNFTFMGLIEISILNAFGDPYDGRVRFNYGAIGGNSMRSSNLISFSSPPYLLPIASPAFYGGVIDQPELQELSIEGSVVFSGSDGKVEAIEIQLASQ